MSGPHLTTLHAFVRELEALDIKFSSDERAELVAKAAREIKRLTPIIAARERDRLLRMPCSDTVQ